MTVPSVLVRLGQRFWYNLKVGICLVLLVALVDLVSKGMAIASALGFALGFVGFLVVAVIGAAVVAFAQEAPRWRRRRVTADEFFARVTQTSKPRRPAAGSTETSDTKPD